MTPPSPTVALYWGPIPPTRTPFRPHRPTSVHLPTATPTFTPTPSPTPTPPFEDRILFLLLGSDQRWRYSRWFRTDTIILAIYNPSTGALSLVSFPRDLYVHIPGIGYNRINVAMEYGGFPLLAATLEENFGVRPEYYALIRMQDFKRLIEILGGVDVVVPQRLCDRWPKGGWKCLDPGPHHLDADEALWYARSRMTTSDFSRIRRQQDILKAVARKLMSMDALHRAPELYALFSQMVETNIGPADVPYLAFQARRFDPEKIYSYPIQREHVTPWIKPSGAYVLLPNHDAIRALLQQAFSH